MSRAQAIEDLLDQELVGAVVVDGEPTSLAPLRRRMQELGVPGVSIAIIDNGEVAWTGGFGAADTETGRGVTADTLFQAGSISKPVAAMGALRLVQEGHLTLDADVNEQLRGWRIPNSDLCNEQAVTLRRLLSHTAGTTVHGFPGYAHDVRMPTVPEVLDGKGNTPAVIVDLEPGTEFRYSGGGYTVMQQLLVDVTGRPFPDLMRELVLAPLGMDVSTFEQPLPAAMHAIAAHGHATSTVPVPGRWHAYPEMAAAGLWTTPCDLARFAIAVQQANAGERETILSQPLQRQMLTPQLGAYGLGLRIEPGAFGHAGANAGFISEMTATLDGHGVVVTINAMRGRQLIPAIVRTIFQACDWPGHRPVQKSTRPLTATALAAFAGKYQVEPHPIFVDVRVEGPGLIATAPGAPQFTLFPESDTRFFALETGASVDFEVDSDRVVAMRIPGQRFKRQ